MTNRWRDFDKVLKRLRLRIRDTAISDEMRQWLQDMYNDLFYHRMTLDDIIYEAEQSGIRNPAFPDDLVGWLDDDFDDDDEDNEDE